MSSPIHFDEQIDPALTYAPPWARDREAPIAQCPEPSQFDTDEPGRTLTRTDPEFSGDRALLELQRQLALDPDFIPEPPSEGALALRPVLIRYLIQTAKDRGCVKMELELHDGNFPAQSFYEKIGFQTVGRRRRFYDLGRGALCDAILMERSL